MARIQLKDLTSKGLKALAQDVKFPKYSSLDTKSLRNGLLKADLSKVDFSKYDSYDIEEESIETEAEAMPKAKSNKAEKVPVNPRRSIRKGLFGRR